MPIHREEGRFQVRVDLTAEFGEDYEGDDDGNVWLDQWLRDVRPRLVAAVFDVLRSDRRFDVVPAPRGASTDREIEIAVKFRPEAATRHRD